MPRYVRESATNVTIATAKVQTRARAAPWLNLDDQESKSTVDRDRRGGVTGRVAGIDGQVLETGDVGTVRVDDERCQAIRRGLDPEHKHEECSDPPSAQHGANERD